MSRLQFLSSHGSSDVSLRVNAATLVTLQKTNGFRKILKDNVSMLTKTSRTLTFCSNFGEFVGITVEHCTNSTYLPSAIIKQNFILINPNINFLRELQESSAQIPFLVVRTQAASNELVDTKHYLKDRTHLFQTDSITSEYIPLQCGVHCVPQFGVRHVPRGSVLGPGICTRYKPPQCKSYSEGMNYTTINRRMMFGKQRGDSHTALEKSDGG